MRLHREKILAIAATIGFVFAAVALLVQGYHASGGMLIVSAGLGTTTVVKLHRRQNGKEE